ncbi:MAG: hypothetical protein ACREBU_14965 [Nitrososphaera sp.]
MARMARGKSFASRIESNEEIFYKAMKKYGHLRLRIQPFVWDSNGEWRTVRQQNIVIRKIKNPGQLFQIIAAVNDAVKKLKEEIQTEKGQN